MTRLGAFTAAVRRRRRAGPCTVTPAAFSAYSSRRKADWNTAFRCEQRDGLGGGRAGSPRFALRLFATALRSQHVFYCRDAWRNALGCFGAHLPAGFLQRGPRTRPGNLCWVSPPLHHRSDARPDCRLPNLHVLHRPGELQRQQRSGGVPRAGRSVQFDQRTGVGPKRRLERCCSGHADRLLHFRVCSVLGHVEHDYDGHRNSAVRAALALPAVLTAEMLNPPTRVAFAGSFTTIPSAAPSRPAWAA